MFLLDFFTRLILIPGCLLFVLCFIPEVIKDTRMWKKELFKTLKSRNRYIEAIKGKGKAA